MKNFKKVLALVLAIATLLSFATVASAKTADFADAKDVKNTEAVDVLSYIKVLEGYPADNTFKPAKNITREEAAKIIAIFANKSTDISSLYTSANPFADMKGRWGESYVAYGYRAGIIAGKNATSFVPKANVKGTEFLKMVLVVLGYDQNKEGLVGSSWAVNTLELAKAKKLLAGLGKDFDPNAALTRDQAAQIMLNALEAEKVVYGQTITNLVWNAKTGYWMTTNTVSNAVYVSPNGAVNNYEHKLLADDFGLKLVDSVDKWGRPAHTWSKGTATIGQYLEAADKSYTTAVTECQIASDLGYTADTTLPVIVNGQSVGNYNIQRLDTVGKIGAQGRLTEIYEDRIVMIDTFLAKVEKVVDATFDAAGHLKTPSSITLTAFDVDTDATTATNNVVLTNGSTNYGYVKGDYVLIYAYTGAQTVSDCGAILTRETNNVKPYAEILGKAESFEGAQTVLWYNTAKHTVSGTVYDDAVKFHLDQAKQDIVNYTWFKDTYGNLIGAVKIATAYSYGVVTEMWFSGDFATGAGKTLAKVKYVDGTDNTITVSSIKPLGFTNAIKPVAGATSVMSFTDAVNGTVAVSYSAVQNEKEDGKTGNKDVIDGHLFEMSTKADGSVDLVEKAPNWSGNQKQIGRGILATSASTVAKVDNATKFLVRSAGKVSGAYVYTAIVGAKDFATYTKTATNDVVVDAVIDTNGYASVVYLTGDSDASKAYGFAYVVGTSYTGVLKKDEAGIDYYEVTLATQNEEGTGNATVKVKATDTSVLTTLTEKRNFGKLFYIDYEGGYVKTATLVTIVYKHGQIGTAPYTYRDYDTANTNDDKNTYALGFKNYENTASYSEGFLDLGVDGYRYYIPEGTPVVGSLTNLDGKVIYVVGNESGVVSKVFVSDFDKEQDSTVTEKTWTKFANDTLAWSWDNEAEKLGTVKVLDKTMSFKELYAGMGTVVSYKASYTTGTNKVTLESTDTTLISYLLAQPDAVLEIKNSSGTWTIVMG